MGREVVVQGMKVISTPLAGVVVIEPRVFPDGRGYFMETFSQSRYQEAGIETVWVQDNLARSTKGVLRGLHYQKPNAQAKLIQCALGEIFDVAVDIRRGSPTFGQWHGEILSQANHRQMLVPTGFAHGYCVISDEAVVLYKCSTFYSPEDEGSVLWEDPAVGIEWPDTGGYSLSDKDKAAPLLAEIPAERLFKY